MTKKTPLESIAPKLQLENREYHRFTFEMLESIQEPIEIDQLTQFIYSRL